MARFAGEGTSAGYPLGSAGALENGRHESRRERPWTAATLPHVHTGVNLRVLRAWLALVLWVAVIAGMGSDPMSNDHTTSRFLGPLFDWLLPGLSESARGTALYTIRKSAHAIEYAILALLGNHALRLSWRMPPLLTSLISLAVVLVVAIADEAHQGFTSLRTSSGWDVLLDTTGGLAALAGIWLVRRLRASSRTHSAEPQPTPNAEKSP